MDMRRKKIDSTKEIRRAVSRKWTFGGRDLAEKRRAGRTFNRRDDGWQSVSLRKDVTSGMAVRRLMAVVRPFQAECKCTACIRANYVPE